LSGLSSPSVTLSRTTLYQNGFALHNLASLPHISIAGACSTGTHGSGETNKNLSSAVSALEMVTGTGDIVKLSRDRDGDVFRGAVVGLGALGVITRVTLDIEPTFMMQQCHSEPQLRTKTARKLRLFLYFLS
jgi:alditol oxidase